MRIIAKSAPRSAGGAPAGVDLLLGVLREGHADGVPQAIHEQRANADRALHTPILALARLRMPQNRKKPERA